MKYRVVWRSKKTGATGHGDPLDDREAVERIIMVLNRKYPEINHWVESVEDSATTKEQDNA